MTPAKVSVPAGILVIPAALERPGIVTHTDHWNPVQMEQSYKSLAEPPEGPSRDACWYAWAAGIFDGESHIGFNSRGGVIAVHQASSNGVPQMLTRLQEMFGGDIYHKTPRPDHGELQPLYEWKLRRRELIEKALRCVWPWLGDIKRDQADRAIANYKGPELAKINKGISARRRWADPAWRAAHPAAVAHAARFASAPRPVLSRDPDTGRYLKGKAS